MIKAIKFGVPICWNSKGGTVEPWLNSFTGTFSNGEPLSIMINNYEVIRDNSCHSLWGYPESVLWIKTDGSHGVSRVQTYTQIPGWKDIKFAIGGLGISNLNAELEGFCTFEAYNPNTNETEVKKFGDVTDYVKCSVFGFKDDVFFASIMEGTPEQIKAKCEEQGFTDVVKGDGRTWASWHTLESQENMDHPQYSIVQMTNIVEIELVDKPVDTVDKPIYTANVFKLSDLANPHTPILPGLHFYFDEYLQNNLTLSGYNKDYNVVTDPNIMYEIIFHALMMEEYRSQIGRGISCTSGYRPDEYNDVVLIKKGYKSTKTSDHKYKKSAALDTNVPVTTDNINKWKALCKKKGVSYSIGLYKWGLHLGYRRNQSVRLWDWR